MDTQKYENMLNLALDTPEEQRMQTNDLNTGFNITQNTWQIIVRYNGSLDFLKSEGADITYLIANYAILTLPETLLRRLNEFEQIIYAELPKTLYLSVIDGKRVSCINPVQLQTFSLGNSTGGLFGEGVLCAVIDSGIDFTNPAFLNADGTTRILRLWDQSIFGTPPEGYLLGTVYDETQINQALQTENEIERNNLVPSRDISGHGTHVTGIMAGNFADDRTQNIGIATKSKLIIVKLDTTVNNGFPRTTELMLALDYVYRTALAFNMPVSINLSFGNSYGSHDGTSILEQFIDDLANLWKMTICIGTGNEGADAGHSQERFMTGEQKEIAFSVGAYETTLNIQIWKSYQDDIQFTLFLPGNPRGIIIQNTLGKQEFILNTTRVLIYYGEPSPYSLFQEIYIELIPAYDTVPYISTGIWRIEATAGKVPDGQIDLWLPDAGARNSNTFFLRPSPDVTLTIPSTATSIIAVGGYNSNTFSYADFSGRGFTRTYNQVRPDLVAPAVDILSAAVGGGLERRSGTSMATPFVSGSAALLMEYGIVRGNDPYLYGEKAKAYFIKGARQLSGFSTYPNPQVGWGALCLRDSLPQ